MAKDPFQEAFDALNSKYASTLDASPLSHVDSWIDTGSYALNAIISGSLFGGWQKGRICGLAGPSGCGKTLMIVKGISNFLAENPQHRAVIFDSEIAVDRSTVTALGCDPARIKHVPVNTVDDVRNQCLNFIDKVVENDLHGKFIIALDSLGNLAASKEIDDARTGKTASDMGTRAKQIKSMLRTLTYAAAAAKITILFSNHIYDDPAALYPTAVKYQSGGRGPEFMASLLVQLGFKRQKTDKDYSEEETLAQAKQVGGILMHALTTKNRFIPPMLECDIYNNFKTGLNRYSGLFEIAKNLGVIEGTKTYQCNGTNLGYRKSFETNPEVWEKVIIPVLEPVLNKEFKFSQSNKDVS